MPLPKTLFVSRETGASAWYRCALPAVALGAEWTTLTAPPPGLALGHGIRRADLEPRDLAGYDVLVIQQPYGQPWVKAVQGWQARGVRVLVEVDDWMRGVRRMEDHDFAHKVTRKAIDAFELALRLADGVICSTPWLAERCARFNPATFVCRNGIDLPRYALTRPARDTVTIGWAGATGHRDAMRPWLEVVADVLRARPEARFASVGQPFADALAGEFGRERALSVPFAPLEAYPAAMSRFDIALAPAGEGNFFRAKSDLRWLEASALGIPVVADPAVYPEISDGVTGLRADSPEAARDAMLRLVDDAALRARVGEAARADVTARRRVEVTAQDWAQALHAVAPLVEEVA